MKKLNEIHKKIEENSYINPEKSKDRQFENLFFDLQAALHENSFKNIINKRQREIIVNALIDCINLKSLETEEHVRRVGKYAATFGKLLNYNKQRLESLYIAGSLHDIGKIMIPNDILHKKGKLTNVEYGVMQSHPTLGCNIFKNYKNSVIKEASIAILEHHEKFDGSGYPNRIAGNKISSPGQIIAIADTFDALSSKRSYKNEWKQCEIINYMNKQKNHSFDPVLVDMFINNIGLFYQINREN